jgi:hypothetical protein
MREEDIDKIAFDTVNSLMECVATPFDLCNAPNTFQRMMSDGMRDFLHKFIIVYLDDVCAYNRSRGDT